MNRKINFTVIKKRYRDFLRFSVFLLPYWKVKVISMVSSGILVPLGLVMPYLTKLMIDKAFAKRDLVLFVHLSLLGAAVFIITAILDGISSYLEQKISLKVDFDINSKLFKHIQKMSLSFFKDKATGEHIFMLNHDAERITDMVNNTLHQFMLFLLRLFFLSAMVFYLSWKMALLCFFISPLIYICSHYYFLKRREIFKKEIELSESIFVKLEEVFSHIYLVKAFGRESFEISDFLGRLVEKLKLLLKLTRLQLYSAFTGNGVTKLVLGTVSVFGGYQIIKGQFSLGGLTAIMIYFSQLIGILGSIGGLFQQLSFDFISCDRITKVLDRRPDIADKPNALAFSLSKADIEFRNVTFGYKQSVAVLKDLSFHIKQGSSIALVGNSGCGKTTLINLILRLYEPQKGKILISGDDINDIKMDCLKDQIGAVLQEPFLWNDTIENNIKYARPDASFEQVVRAAQLSGADNFIGMMPGGYNTHMGENAALISQGQKQRIAIARAIIKNPAIIILDEALSSLDSESEDRIFDNIRSKFNSSTIIIVSHRLSTVKKMDLLYFLQAPDRMDVGRHEEFLENNQRYRELFSSQIEPVRSYKL